jgi:hypothetical protein
MSPKLERGTKIDNTAFTKFLRVGKKIIFDKPNQEHEVIANNHGLPRVVDDGGYIEPTGERPHRGMKFVLTTKTCFIKGNRSQARAETVRIAREILGNDKVA